MDRIELFATAALAGMMAHVKLDQDPKAVAALAVKFGKATAEAFEEAATAPKPEKAAKGK